MKLFAGTGTHNKKGSRVGASIIERGQILQNLHSNARNHEHNRIAKVKCLEIRSKLLHYYFVALRAFLTLCQYNSSNILNPHLHYHKSILNMFHVSTIKLSILLKRHLKPI